MLVGHRRVGGPGHRALAVGVRGAREAGLVGEQHPGNPGGRLGERRVPTPVFSGVTKALAKRGITPIVTWGPGEEALAKEVLAGGAGVLAPPTSLDELAALMAGARVVVCNNTGPMHLSVAVGAKTVALFWKMPIDQWGHSRSPHVMLDLTNEPGIEAMVARVDASLDIEAATTQPRQ